MKQKNNSKKGFFMKSIKNIAAVIILFSVSCIQAKRTAATKPTTLPTITPIVSNTPSSSKKVSVKSAPEKANIEINAELAKIERSQNAIKDSAYNVLNDTKISLESKNKFMNEVQAAYDVMNESAVEGYTELLNKLRQLRE